MRDLMFAFVWLAAMPLTMMATDVGVLMWVWVALLSPNSLLYGFMSTAPLNKIIAVLTIFLVFVKTQKNDPYFDITSLLLIMFGLAATVSWYGGIVPSAQATDLYQKLLKEITLFFVIATVLTTRAQIDRLVFVIVLSLGFLGFKEGLIFLLTAGGHQIIGNGALGDNNGLAAALLMALPLLLYLARYSVLRIVKIGMLAVLGLSVVTVVATYSRGGFIGLVVLGAFLVKNSRHRLLMLLLSLFTGALVYYLAPETWFHRIHTIESADDDGSFLGRVIAWKISLLIAMDHPLFGGGMHAVQNLLVWDTYKPDIDRVNFMDTPPASVFARAAHSIYFEVLGDLGFVGLTIFLAILGVALWNCRWLYRMCRGHASLAWAADLARMVQISLVVYLVTGAALSNAYFELSYVLIALVSRCRRTVRLALAAEAAQRNEQPNAGARAMQLGSPPTALATASGGAQQVQQIFRSGPRADRR
jgi:probable O-glycosylation ligase (exosortase A-associated)